MRLRASFLYLCMFTMLGIFLHELGHHLVGIPSLMSLSRNWPLVRVTPELRQTAIRGSLAGPAVNLFLGYGSLLLYRFSRLVPARSAGLYSGLANLFLVLSGASINLIVDWASGSWGNDLQQVSLGLGWNVLILPATFITLSVPGLAYLYARWVNDGKRRLIGFIVLVGAWFLAGLILMLLDAVLHIRFRLR